MAPMMKRPAAAAGVDNVPAICKRPSVKLEREPSMTPKVKSEPEVEFPPLPRLQSSPSGTDEMKHGPGSLEELLAWATDAVSTVVADPGNQWLQNIKRGICIGTHFSGMKTPEVALQQLLQATKVLCPEADVRRKLLQAWSCDPARECVEIAMCFEHDPQIWAPMNERRGHVFSSILDCLSPTALEHVANYKKYRDLGKKAEALQVLEGYLLRHADEALEAARCWKHGRHCRLVACVELSFCLLSLVFFLVVCRTSDKCLC